MIHPYLHHPAALHMYEERAFQSIPCVFLNNFSVITADYEPTLTTVWNEINSPVLEILPAYCTLMSVCLGGFPL